MKNYVIVRGANDLTACAVQRHGSLLWHGGPWPPMPCSEIPPSGQDDMGEAAMRGGVKRRCVPSMNSHVIVRETNDLTGCAVQRHGSSPQHGVSWTPAASLHENHVIVSGANDLTDCAVQRHRSSPQHSAPWNAMPSGAIPPGACPELRRKGSG
jgi:uncharacterized Zn-binding protein involved in type VI secretion